MTKYSNRSLVGNESDGWTKLGTGAEYWAQFLGTGYSMAKWLNPIIHYAFKVKDVFGGFSITADVIGGVLGAGFAAGAAYCHNSINVEHSHHCHHHHNKKETKKKERNLENGTEITRLIADNEPSLKFYQRIALGFDFISHVFEYASPLIFIADLSKIEDKSLIAKYLCLSISTLWGTLVSVAEYRNCSTSLLRKDSQNSHDEIDEVINISADWLSRLNTIGGITKTFSNTTYCTGILADAILNCFMELDYSIMGLSKIGFSVGLAASLLSFYGPYCSHGLLNSSYQADNQNTGRNGVTPLEGINNKWPRGMKKLRDIYLASADHLDHATDYAVPVAFFIELLARDIYAPIKLAAHTVNTVGSFFFAKADARTCAEVRKLYTPMVEIKRPRL